MLKSFLLVNFLCAASIAQAAQDVRLWHAMSGAPAIELEKLAAQFNASQSEYRVVPANKGSYEETLAAALAAHKGASGPHIVQVNEVGTGDMLAAKDAVRPLWQVMG